MAFKNIAKYGYKQTLASAGAWAGKPWDLGGRRTMTFAINNDRADMFDIVLFGPITEPMKEQQRLNAALGVALDGPATMDRIPATLSKGGSLAVLFANMLAIAKPFASDKKFVQMSRRAFGLGAPIYHGSASAKERERSTFAESMKKRDGFGLFTDLGWVADHYTDVIGQGPYFNESGQRWWESGIIVLPLPTGDTSKGLVYPKDLILRVRTDVGGSTLYLQLYYFLNHQLRQMHTGIFTRATTEYLIPPDSIIKMDVTQTSI